MKRKWFCLGTVFFVLMTLAMVNPCPAQHLMGDDLDIRPKTLAGCKSGGVLTATWDLPDGWSPSKEVEIDIIEIGGMEAFIPLLSYEFKPHRGDYHLKLKYSCDQIRQVITGKRGEVRVTLGGTFNGEYVEGWDDIHVRRR